MTHTTNPSCRRSPAIRRIRASAAAAAVSLAALALAAGGCRSDGIEAVQSRSTPAQARRPVQPKSARTTQQRAAQYRDRAVVLYDRGELKAAREALRCARRIDPSDVLTCQMESRVALDLGNQEDYRDALRAVLAASPRSALLHNTVGVLLAQDGDMQGGLAALERAVALHPANAEYARDLAAACVSAELPVAAEHALKAALAHNPADASLLVALAKLHESREAWGAAVETYETLLVKQPENALWVSQRTRCLDRIRARKAAPEVFADRIKSGDHAVILAACEQSVDAGPNAASLRKDDPQDGPELVEPSGQPLNFEPPVVVEPASAGPEHSADWVPHRRWRAVGH